MAPSFLASKQLMLFLTLFCSTMAAPETPDACDEGSETCALNARLWAHICLMVLAFGLIFPFGMVLGMIRSDLHIPVQTVGTVVAMLAYPLGYTQRGHTPRHSNVHSIFAKILMSLLILQAGMGAVLRLEVNKLWTKKPAKIARRVLVVAHNWLGKSFPVMAWTQMLFGVIVAMGFCLEDHLGQCLAHFIMGSWFIGIGIVMLIVLLAGQAWLRKTGQSQEFFESVLVAVWGCFNTFTEHRWGTPWIRNDLQHTSLGIIWWSGGTLGAYLSYPRGGHGPRRSVLPALVILITGWVFTSHPQDLVLSAKVHAVFGWTLVGAGAARLIEISCIVRMGGTVNAEVNEWQHVTPLLYCAAGFMFMGANEEQIQILSDANVSHGTFALVMYSAAFLLYLFVNVILHQFTLHTRLYDKRRLHQSHRLCVSEIQHTSNREGTDLELLASDSDSFD